MTKRPRSLTQTAEVTEEVVTRVAKSRCVSCGGVHDLGSNDFGAAVDFTSARKRKVAELLSACLNEPRECDYGRKKSCRGLGKRSRFEACFATVLMSFGTRLASET